MPMLDRTRKLLNTEPDSRNPEKELIEVLYSAIELLSLPDNDFSWSSWSDQTEAADEIKAILSKIEDGNIPHRLSVAVLFAPTGPIQEVSLSSGWGDIFLKVAERYDFAEKLLWQLPG